MKYMLLMYADEKTQFTPEEQMEVAKDWGAFNKEIQAAGVMLASGGLLGISNATTVRVREGKTLTADGPFAETHEQLGGFVQVDCKDLDEALGWAAKIPHARYGSVEVRPMWTPDAQP